MGAIHIAADAEIIRNNDSAIEDIPGPHREPLVKVAARTQVRRFEPTRRGLEGDPSAIG